MLLTVVVVGPWSGSNASTKCGNRLTAALDARVEMRLARVLKSAGIYCLSGALITMNTRELQTLCARLTVHISFLPLRQ